MKTRNILLLGLIAFHSYPSKSCEFSIKKTPINEIIINFDKGLRPISKKVNNRCTLCNDTNKMTQLKKLYEKNHYSQLIRSETPKIPKIIHHIWVGPKPIPEILEPLRQTWMALHPGWTFMLWTNEKVKELQWYNETIKKMYESSKQPLEQADLVRLQALYTYGGIYTDADQQCLKSFEELHHYYDFYVGTVSDAGNIIFPNGLIGAASGHPILKHLLDNIGNMRINQKIPNDGVKYFSRELETIIYNAPGNNIALPPTLFYSVPFGYQKNNADISEFVVPESMIINYWAWSTKLWEKSKPINLTTENFQTTIP